MYLLSLLLLLLFFTKIQVFTEIKVKLPKVRNNFLDCDVSINTHAFNQSWEAENMKI